MKKVYSWKGLGYFLNEVKIDDENIQDALECDDMETVIKYMIDTEQCYYIDLKDKGGITPMVGCLHDWEFKNDADLAVGFYYSYKKWNFYLWGNDILKDNPRIVVGVDFKLSTK